MPRTESDILSISDQEVNAIIAEHDGERRDLAVTVARLRHAQLVPLCGTCKHWGRPKDDGETFRVCVSTIHVGKDIGNPDIDGDTINSADLPFRFAGAYDGTVPPPTPVRLGGRCVVDGSGYFAALKCREDFGCVAHEARTVDS